MPNENPDSTADKAKEGGKKILKGVGKAGVLFSKRVSEGMVNASMAQHQEKDPLGKLVAAGTEIGKAVVKGSVEGVQKSAPDILSGINEVAGAIQKKISKKKE